MSRWFHVPCPKCGSKDNLGYKEGDEWGFCFGCSSNVKLDGDIKPVTKENYDMHTLEEIGTYGERGFQERDIKKVVAKHYGVKVSYAVSSLTEIICALFLILFIHWSLRGKFFIGALILSFMPFARSEGFVIIGVAMLFFFFTHHSPYSSTNVRIAYMF